MGMDNVLHIIMNNDFMILFCSWHSPNSDSIPTPDTRARRDPWEASLGIPLMGQPSTRTDVKVSVNHPQQKHTEIKSNVKQNQAVAGAEIEFEVEVELEVSPNRWTQNNKYITTSPG